MSPQLFAVLILTFLLNLPFGYWRGTVKKFSIAWFIAIHFPVVLLYFIRSALGVERSWITLPIMIVLFFLGQLLGRKIYEKTKKSEKK